MILYGVRWQDEEGKGFMRSEFTKAEQAISKAKALETEGKFNVNIKMVDSKNDKFVGDLTFKEIDE